MGAARPGFWDAALGFRPLLLLPVLVLVSFPKMGLVSVELQGAVVTTWVLVLLGFERFLCALEVFRLLVLRQRSLLLF